MGRVTPDTREHAYAQGADARPGFYLEEQPLKRTRTLEEWPVIDPDKYPTFAKALAGRGPDAQTVKISYLVDNLDGSVTLRENYTQIVRMPGQINFDEDQPTEEELKAELLGKLIEAIEPVLLYGQRGAEGVATLRTFCGGAIDQLGREPVVGDRLSIRFLRGRDLVLTRTEYADKVVLEYLTEFTLEAH